MSAFYWLGFVLGTALVLAVIAAPLALLVPAVRRRMVYVPVLRLVTGRVTRRQRAAHKAASEARVAELEQLARKMDQKYS